MENCKENKNGREVPEGCHKEKECFLKKVKSNTLKVSGGCDECDTVQIELKEPQECQTVIEMMPNDTITFKRNGQDYCIKFSDFAKIACKKCLD